MTGQRNTPDLIVDVLREAIGRGMLRPGQALSQAELSQQFGVSVIPVREALRRLEADGLVVVRHNRGAFVAKLTPVDVRELYEIRSPLEVQALRLALPNLTAKDVRAARDVLDRLDRVDDGESWTVLDREFHLTLYRPCGRSRLLGLIGRLRTNTELYHSALNSVVAVYPECQVIHRAIVDACAAGEVERPLTLLAEHLREGGERLAWAVAEMD